MVSGFLTGHHEHGNPTMAVVPMSVMPMVMAWFVCFVVTTSQQDEAIVNALKNKSISPSRLVRTTCLNKALSQHTRVEMSKRPQKIHSVHQNMSNLSRRPIGGAGDPQEHRQLL